LVGGVVPQGELPSLMETIVSNLKAAVIVGFLQRSDAQVFIDVMDEVCPSFSLAKNKFIAEISPFRRLIMINSLFCRKSARNT
jgi:hypothetical protein